MVLDLKKVFLNENERLSAACEFEMVDPAGEITYTSPVNASVTVSNHAGMVVYESEVRFSGHILCSRCCEPFNKDFAYRFNHILVASLPEGQDDDYIEAPDYMLDTDALLRDDILLELPSKFLCKDTCKGLCPKCGKNLNKGKCGCPEKEVDPRLAVLSKLLEE